MLYLLLPLSLMAAPKDLGSQIDTLGFHLERLHDIPVPADLQEEKDRKLAELGESLDGIEESQENIDRIYFRMDEVRTWLLANAIERPAMPEGGLRDEDDAWVVRNPEVTVRVDKETLALSAETPGGTWATLPSSERDAQLRDGTSLSLAAAGTKEATPFHTGYSVGMLITLSGFADAPEFRLGIRIGLEENEAVIDIFPMQDIRGLDVIEWPKPFETGDTEDDLAVIPRMQGILVPGNLEQEIEMRDLCNSRTLYMPWWGQIHNGRGVQTILETSDDAGAEYVHPSGGPTRIQPLWYSSMGRVRYPRTMRLVFDDEATYVRMAKRYRRLVRERGDFVSLDEKLTRTPNLANVIGHPVVHIGALYHTVEGSRFFRTENAVRNHRIQTFDQVADQLETLKEKGIDEAYVHLDGWGYAGYDNTHPDYSPPGYEQGGPDGMRRLADLCDRIGYLLAVHDQYRDFYHTAVSFADHLSIHDWQGTRPEHAEWIGSYQAFLSPRYAPGYVRKNHDYFREHGIKVKGAYLDVFAVVPLEESFNEVMPLTRTDCAEYRRDCVDLLRAWGYVVSSEEPADYLTRSIDLVHHGPYPTAPKGYGPGEAIGIPVPLFNLVYHDSLLLPWYPTDDGGWGIPNGDAGWLHCALNTGLPYVSPGNSEEQIARVKELAALAGRLGTLEMTNHEFLDGARRIQRTTFSDGTTVTVDFDKKTYVVEGGGRL